MESGSIHSHTPMQIFFASPHVHVFDVRE